MLKFIYRMSHECYRCKIPFIPRFIQLLGFLMFNSSISCKSRIGKGTKFGHGGIGVVIHPKAIIGNNCLIGTNVTLGAKSDMEPEAPTIGNNVYISTGSKLIGNINIGNNIVIGANSVVMINVPDNSVVAGVPAKVVKTNINIKDYFSL